MRLLLIGLILSGLLLAGCQSLRAEPAAVGEAQAATAVSPQPSPTQPQPPTLVVTPKINTVVMTEPPTLTPVPTEASPTPAPPTPTFTPTPIGLCSLRVPSDDLFTLVTQTYNLSRNYAPQDLVLLTDYLPMDVTLGYPTELREIALQPLLNLINDMKMAGLQPQILSGYRSYSAQSIAWDKWNREEPERAAIISARPGHSEHQLGTVIDFGSPALPDIVGTPDIQFHTYFFKTPEGVWLLENAHRYGFTLSYTREAEEVTGFYYEPWHYRFVGEEMATRLKDQGMTLTQYQLSTQVEPCIPD